MDYSRVEFMIHILTGPVHSGKTTLLQRLTFELKNERLAVDGFLSLAVKENKTFIGYDLYDLMEEISAPFIRKKGEDRWQKIGDYYFIPKTLATAKNIILRSGEADIKVIDEVGPLELKEGGLWPALTKTLALATPDFICVIRNTILDEWLEKLKNTSSTIFDITEKDLYPKMRQYFVERFIAVEQN
jgi:nucleoside-triphosphatase THEP1